MLPDRDWSRGRATKSMRFYAVVESVEDDSLAGTITVQLDAIDAASFDRISSAFDRGSTPTSHLEGIRRLRAAVLVVSAPSDQRDLFQTAETARTWILVTLRPKGGNVSVAVYDGLDSDEPAVLRFLQEVRPVAEAQRAGLGQITALLGNYVSTPVAISDELRKLKSRQLCHVGVVDVGQGSCTGVFDDSGVPGSYVDLGGGCGANGRTWPRELKLCFSSNPLVILTHWDWDHFAGAFRLGEECGRHARSMQWIAPAQPLGIWGAKLAGLLISAKRLLVWDEDLGQVSCGQFAISRCRGGSMDRNNSGLVVRVSSSFSGFGDSPSVLICGDASYSVIPRKFLAMLQGIVVPHHGGNTLGTIPRPFRRSAKAAISFGAGNKYGHPKQSTIDSLRLAGWHQIATTADCPLSPTRGHVLMLPTGGIHGARVVPPCDRRQCTLDLRK